MFSKPFWNKRHTRGMLHSVNFKERASQDEFVQFICTFFSVRSFKWDVLNEQRNFPYDGCAWVNSDFLFEIQIITIEQIFKLSATPMLIIISHLSLFFKMMWTTFVFATISWSFFLFSCKLWQCPAGGTIPLCNKLHFASGTWNILLYFLIFFGLFVVQAFKRFEVKY